MACAYRFRSHCSPRRIQNIYQRYLSRPADAADLAHRLDKYHQGAANKAIVTGFLA